MFRRVWARLRGRWTRLWRYLGDVFKSSGFWWVALVLSTLAVCGYLTLIYWSYLHDGNDSLSATVRNVSLIIGGVIAVELALWRSIVGERQAETAQRDLLNQQFQTGAEMLGSSVLSVRLGGLYTLKHLAMEHPEHYHVQVMEQLCAFIRGAIGAHGQSTAVIEEVLVTREDSNEFTYERFRARNDIQEAMNAIATCHGQNLAIETTGNYWLDLQGADLRGANLSQMNLSRAPLQYGYSTTVYQQLLTGNYTDMRGARMDEAILALTKLSGVDLTGATGLTQDELDIAIADPDNPPKLNDVTDARTGKPIVWSGFSAKGE